MAHRGSALTCPSEHLRPAQVEETMHWDDLVDAARADPRGQLPDNVSRDSPPLTDSPKVVLDEPPLGDNLDMTAEGAASHPSAS
eukprot:8590761-Prorocentrum_lima.AAC.1